MPARTIRASELPVNADGSIYHLALRPEELATTVLLVGDPDRVEMIASKFESVEVRRQHREFVSATGRYNGCRITALSTGIGCDNIDIVMTELDALVNVDLKGGFPRTKHRQLRIVRIGTCGSMQPDVPAGSWIATEIAVGFDGLLNFYRDRNVVSDLTIEAAIKDHLGWRYNLTQPYVVHADSEMLNYLTHSQHPDAHKIVEGMTISAPGFYGPQGRVVRLFLPDKNINKKVASFDFKEVHRGLDGVYTLHHRITNYEMEASAIYGMSRMMKHRAAAICLVIADRRHGNTNLDYNSEMSRLVDFVLWSITH